MFNVDIHDGSHVSFCTQYKRQIRPPRIQSQMLQYPAVPCPALPKNHIQNCPSISKDLIWSPCRTLQCWLRCSRSTCWYLSSLWTLDRDDAAQRKQALCTDLIVSFGSSLSSGRGIGMSDDSGKEFAQPHDGTGRYRRALVGRKGIASEDTRTIDTRFGLAKVRLTIL